RKASAVRRSGSAMVYAPMTESMEKPTFVYRGRRYDVSEWLARHPGGDILERFVGQDATCAMHMCHDMRHKGIQKLLKKLEVDGAPPEPIRAFDSDYLELEAMFYERGWFTPSLRWYFYKAAIVFALLGTAFAVPGPWLKAL